MIVYIYNIGVDLYNGFNGLRHRINWTYFTVLDGLAHPLYSRNEKLTTKGIEYILYKYIKNCKATYPKQFKNHYNNHSMRHSRAMHLLESGINLIYIRDILGHSSVVTTEIYAKTNAIIKEKQIREHSKNLQVKERYSENQKADLLKYLKNLK